MNDAIEEAKARARLLHRRVRDGDEEARLRLARLPEFGGEAPDPEQIQRKHCLAVIGRELGFAGWPHAHRVLAGDPDELDFGTLLYPRGCGGFTNQWFAAYDEARRTRELTRGYLLAYRRQFFVVTGSYVEAMGLHPHDPDWGAMGWDWARPQQPAARARLYAKLLASRPREAA